MRKFVPAGFYGKQAEKFCPHCNARLGPGERRRRKHSTKILCRRCGRKIPGGMVTVGNTKFPEEMIRKKFRAGVFWNGGEMDV